MHGKLPLTLAIVNATGIPATAPERRLLRRPRTVQDLAAADGRVGRDLRRQSPREYGVNPPNMDEWDWNRDHVKIISQGTDDVDANVGQVNVRRSEDDCSCSSSCTLRLIAYQRWTRPRGRVRVLAGQDRAFCAWNSWSVSTPASRSSPSCLSWASVSLVSLTAARRWVREQPRLRRVGNRCGRLGGGLILGRPS